MSSRITTDNINLGNGVLEIGSYAAGVFQSYTDVGAIKGTATLTYGRETAKFETGRPMVVVKEEVIRETVELRVTLAELTVANLKLVLGGGTSSNVATPTFLTGDGYALYGNNVVGSSSVAASKVFKFGSDPQAYTVALRFTHLKDPSSGKREVVEVYKAVFSGNLALPFNETDWNTFEVSFTALADTSKAVGEQLLQYVDET